MNKIYKVNISDSLLDNIHPNNIKTYADKLVKKVIKDDLGEFAFEDYIINFKNFRWEKNPDTLEHNYYYNYEVTENLKNKQMIKELEERLKIGF